MKKTLSKSIARAGLALLVFCLVLQSGVPGLQAGASGEAPQVQADSFESQVILVLFRNGAYDAADPDGAVLQLMRFALNLLDGRGTAVSVYPLLLDRNAPFAEGLVPEGGMEALDPVFEALGKPGKPADANRMKKAVGDSLDKALNQAGKGKPTTVIVLQSQAIADTEHPQWAKLRDILSLRNTRLFLLGLAGEGNADLASYAGGLGAGAQQAPEAPPSAPPGQWTPIAPRAEGALLNPQDLESAYRLLAGSLLADVQAAHRIDIDTAEGFSQVGLPSRGASRILLSLDNLLPGHQVVAYDGLGNTPDDTAQPVPIKDFAFAAFAAPADSQETGRTLFSLPDARGPIKLRQEPVGQPDGEAPAPPLSGFAVFDFSIGEGSLTVTAPQGAPFPKKQPVNIGLQVEGEVLNGLLRDDPGTVVELLVASPAGEVYAQPFAAPDGERGGWQAEWSAPVSGKYTAWARLMAGDFFTLSSPLVMLESINQAPAGTSASQSLWLDNPFLDDASTRLDLEGMFQDGDQDALQFEVASGPEGPYGPEAAVEGVGRFSVERNQVRFTPESPEGAFALPVQARDDEGASAQASLGLAWKSVYQSLGAVSLGDLTVSPEPYGKNTELMLSVQPAMPEGTEDGGIRALFLENAKVTAVIREEGAGTLDIPMAYDAEKGGYFASYTTPGRQLEAEIHVQALLDFPDLLLRQPIRLATSPAVLRVVNQPPSWTGGGEVELANLEMRGASIPAGENGSALQGSHIEEARLTLDLAAYFADPDNQVGGDAQDIAYTVRLYDHLGSGWALIPLSPGVYLADKASNAAANRDEPAPAPNPGAGAAAQETPEPALQPPAAGDIQEEPGRETPAAGESAAAAGLSAELTGQSEITLVFREKGQFAVEVTAQDPDGASAKGVFRQLVGSYLEGMLKRLGLYALGALLLLALAYLIRLRTKPSFSGRALSVEVKTNQTLPFSGQVPLTAWGKGEVPLTWVMLYSCVPMQEELQAIAASATLSPHRKGVRLRMNSPARPWQTEGGKPGRRSLLFGPQQSASCGGGDASVSLTLLPDRQTHRNKGNR